MSESQEAVSPVEPAELTDAQIAENLRTRVAVLESQLNESERTATSLRTALQLSEARLGQLECNLTALREQRDLFIEREADALVDKLLIERQKDKELADSEARIKNVVLKHQPLASRLNRANASLSEVRTKFGEMKHVLKTVQAERNDLHEQMLDWQDNCQELRQAIQWYINATRGIKFSIPYRVEKALNVEFGAEHILIAYRASQNSKYTSRNIADFIVLSVRAHNDNQD